MDNNNYIYIHRRKDNGEIFYVGRGTGTRLYQNSSRSNDWKIIAGECGFSAEIYKDGLLFQDAHNLEVFLIENPPLGWNLVNKVKPSQRDYTDPILSEYFTVDEKSPSGLTYIKENKKVKIGQFAGTLSQSGYWNVRIGKQQYLASRVIVSILGEIIPDNYVVNHIDGDTTNNKVSNLEVVSHLENNGRCKFIANKSRSDNTTGVHGVSHCTTRHRYITSITINGVRHRKIFRYTEETKRAVFDEAVSHLARVKENILNINL